jgi:cytochrome c2
MENRSNIVAMMGLGAAIVALGATLVSSEFFASERPEKMGYVVEGVQDDAAAAGGAAAAPVAIASLLPTADAAKGAEVFKKCASCHTVAQGGANGIGPNLYATLGDDVGKGKGGFAFSDVLSGKGGKWDFDKMNTRQRARLFELTRVEPAFAGRTGSRSSASQGGGGQCDSCCRSGQYDSCCRSPCRKCYGT